MRSIHDLPSAVTVIERTRPVRTRPVRIRPARLAIVGLLVVLTACSRLGGTDPDESSDVPREDRDRRSVRQEGAPKRSAADESGDRGEDTRAEDPDTSPGGASTQEFEIERVLPPDAIPSIDDPDFWDADEADQHYGSDELVLGVEIDDDARAYSIPHLSRHEIVNDTVGGRAISVTW